MIELERRSWLSARGAEGAFVFADFKELVEANGGDGWRVK